MYRLYVRHLRSVSKDGVRKYRIKFYAKHSDRKNNLFKNEYIQIAYDHLDTFNKNQIQSL